MNMLSILKLFVDEGKIAGWVRAAVAALAATPIGAALCKIAPASCGAEFQTALSTVLTIIAVGLWSQIAKSKASA